MPQQGGPREGICLPPIELLNKQKRGMAIRGIKLTTKQPVTTKLTRPDHHTDTKLHCYYIGISELR